MFEFRLQIGCLMVVLYICIVYIRATAKGKIACNRIFDAIMYTMPWAIVFDGVTAWTVNHRAVVPDWANLVLHGLFLLLMNAGTTLVFVYMLHEITQFGKHKKQALALALTPGGISTILILATMHRLVFVDGVRTSYSMGIPVYACFASLVIQFGYLFALICVKLKSLEKRKVFSIFSFMVIALGILLVQVHMPEVLISSIIPMIAVLGIYMNFENPSLRRLQRYNTDVVMGFATLVENRDNSTGGHIKRTKDYVGVILQEMRKHPRYINVLSRDYVNHVLNAAPMHDLGKIATPDHILQKPGKLTDEEFEIMKEHAATGGRIIKETFADLDEPEYLQIAYEVARYHHEKWNGKGYPEGLAGEAIPLHARIMAIADVFDAVSAKRCYRDAMPVETCFKIIEEGSGRDFDPELVALFLGAPDKVMECYERDRM